MTRNVAVWFVAGFAVGIISLLAALALSPHRAPAATRADEAPGPIAGFDDSGAAEAIRTLSGKLDRVLALFEPSPVLASNDAIHSALMSDLQTVRGQLELYKVQHNERCPTVDENGRLDTANFVRRLTGRTDQHGKLSASGVYGPYLQMFPSNPFGSVDADKIVFGTDNTPPGKGGGWYFNTRTGKFSANDPDNKGL